MSRFAHTSHRRDFQAQFIVYAGMPETKGVEMSIRIVSVILVVMSSFHLIMPIATFAEDLSHACQFNRSQRFGKAIAFEGVRPVSVGSSCTNRVASTCVAVPDELHPTMTHACSFDQGPRAVQAQVYPRTMPVEMACWDGMSSSGMGIPDGPSLSPLAQQPPAPNAQPTPMLEATTILPASPQSLPARKVTAGFRAQARSPLVPKPVGGARRTNAANPGFDVRAYVIGLLEQRYARSEPYDIAPIASPETYYDTMVSMLGEGMIATAAEKARSATPNAYGNFVVDPPNDGQVADSRDLLFMRTLISLLRHGNAHQYFLSDMADAQRDPGHTEYDWRKAEKFYEDVVSKYGKNRVDAITGKVQVADLVPRTYGSLPNFSGLGCRSWNGSGCVMQILKGDGGETPVRPTGTPADAQIASYTAQITSGQLRGDDLAQAYQGRAKLLIDAKQYERALADLELARSSRAIDRTEEREDKLGYDYFLSARAQFGAKDYQTALSTLAMASTHTDAAQRPEYIALADQMSGELMKARHYDMAAQTDAIAAKLSEGSEKARYTRMAASADILDSWFNPRGVGKAGQYFGAMEAYYNAVQMDARWAKRPGTANAQAQASYEAAILQLKQAEYSQAIPKLDQALRLDPQFLAAYLARGSAELQLKQFASAVNDFFNSLLLQPTSPDAIRGLGVAFEQSGNLPMAESVLRDLSAAELANNGKSPDDVIGPIYEVADRRAAAEGDYELCTFYLRNRSADRSYFDKAVSSCSVGLRLDPGNQRYATLANNVREEKLNEVLGGLAMLGAGAVLIASIEGIPGGAAPSTGGIGPLDPSVLSGVGEETRTPICHFITVGGMTVNGNRALSGGPGMVMVCD